LNREIVLREVSDGRSIPHSRARLDPPRCPEVLSVHDHRHDHA
jgi:hypothetical protein